MMDSDFGSPFCSDCMSKLRKLLDIKAVGRYATDEINRRIEAKRKR
jgi:hypothetical protein